MTTLRIPYQYLLCLFLLLVGCEAEPQGAKSLDTENLPPLSSLEGEHFNALRGSEGISTIFNLTRYEANLTNSWAKYTPDELLLRDILAYSPERVEMEPAHESLVCTKYSLSKDSSTQEFKNEFKCFNRALALAGLATAKQSDLVHYNSYTININEPHSEKAPLSYDINVFGLNDRGVYYLIGKTPMYELVQQKRTAEDNKKLKEDVKNYYYFNGKVTGWR